MKKIALFFSAALFVGSGVFAQAYDGAATYGKKKQKAIIIDYGYAPEAVENAIVLKMEQNGAKVKNEKGLFNKDKGFIVFKKTVLSEITGSTMDYIVKVDSRGKKGAEASTLTFLMNQDGSDGLAIADVYTVGKVKAFLNNMIPDIEAAKLEIMIKEQDDVVAKAEKSLKGLQDDQAKLEKRLKDLEQDIKTNGDNQVSQQKQIEAEKQKLEELKGKRGAGY